MVVIYFLNNLPNTYAIRYLSLEMAKGLIYGNLAGDCYWLVPGTFSLD